MTAPVLAQAVPTAPLTGAGTEIKNKATATYEDPSNPGTINATSNEVTITVAEVAGIAVVGSTRRTGLANSLERQVLAMLNCEAKVKSP